MSRVVPTALLVVSCLGVSALVGCGEEREANPGLAAPGSVSDVPPVDTTASGAGAVAESPSTAPTPPTSTAPPLDAGRGDGGPGGSGTTTLTAPDADPPRKEPTVTDVQRPKDPVRCPSGGGFGKGGGSAARDGFDARDLLGLSTARAQALAKRHDCVVRVVNRDGQELVRTMDYSSNRVNVTETAGRVVRLDGIG